MIIIRNVSINTEYIELDKFLKWSGALPTGGFAKSIIQTGEVSVNGALEIRRSRKLIPGDIVEFDGNAYKVVKGPE